MSESVTKPRSDLGVRTASAIVMVALAGFALWFGGVLWIAFVAIVALGVLYEWNGLSLRFAGTNSAKALWAIFGAVYVGFAAYILITSRTNSFGGDWFAFAKTVQFLLMIIFIDVGAYFFGRTFKGPKIAPSISPSKTWSGLVGGAVGAALIIGLSRMVPSIAYDNGCFGQLSCEFSAINLLAILIGGTVYATIAQAGDFFESWMKRRAGVKDSGSLIPGHGGLFDRADGLIAVAFFSGLLSFASAQFGIG